VPTTTCTDLLRPGGYGRLPRYVANLEARMREVGARAIPDLVLRHAGQGSAAVQAVVRALHDAIGAATGELDAGYGEREREWLHGNCEPRLMDWVASPAPAEPLTAVCDTLADDFERVVAPYLPPAVAAPCRSRLAVLAQTLVDAAGLLNTPVLVAQAAADPRYGAAKNAAVPRKIGSKLWLYDCINCDKCVPVCPNDANFVYDGPEIEMRYDEVEIDAKGELKTRRDAGGAFKVAKGHQLANYADACNDCGNCDVFCPEDGGPYVEKPRFFGSAESYRKYAGKNGFYLETAGARLVIHGTVAGKPYRVELDRAAGRALYDDGVAELEIALEGNRVVGGRVKEQRGTWLHRIEMLPFLTLRYLGEAVASERHVNFVNVATL